MYQQFFSFNVAPFSIAPDPNFIFMSERHQEGLAHLLYGINQGGGFVALTGEVGTGKTTLCHCLLQQLPENIDIALVFNPKLNAIELLATVCDELQIEYDKEKHTLKGLIDALNLHLLDAHASGRRTVLMIDEAQNLSLDVLEQIRLLTNLETSQCKLLQIILIGQPELKQLLEKPEVRQLNQRITARYHLTALSFQETEKYIKHRLTVCGSNTLIFNPAAICKIFKLSQGIPRLINILCDRALLGAYVLNVHTVNKKIIHQAAHEVFNTDSLSFNTVFKYILWGSLILVILAIAVQNIMPSKPEKNHVILSGTFDKNQQQGLPISQKPITPTEKHKLLSRLEFKDFIKQQGVSLNLAISKLGQIWQKDISPEKGCQNIDEIGLKCLFDQSDWTALVALNRPVILEFTSIESEKIYLILTAIKQGSAFFSVNTSNAEISFPIESILDTWQGYYLMLWEPPVLDVSTVQPKQNSKAVLWIRIQKSINANELLRSSNSDYFDDDLTRKVIAFQQLHHLATDGIVGPRTFIHLNNNDPKNKSPKLNP